MLKLLKYEWKACARTCLPLYGVILLVSVVNRLFKLGQTRFDEIWLYNLVQTLMAFLYFGVMVAVFVITTVLLIQRFYKSLLGDEGYLMFTLPVTPAQHIWVKTIIAFVMSTLSMIVAMVSVGVLVSGLDTLSGIGKLIAEACRGIAREPESLLFGLELLLFCVISAVCGILFVYLCIALGHLAKKHRVAMAIVWFFVLSTALQFLLVALMLAADSAALEPLVRAMVNLFEGMQWKTALHTGMVILNIGMLVPTAVFFFGTQHILNRHLNLE